MLRVGSLFSGAGLCDLGLSWAGMEHAFFCEIDPFCRSVLHRHWPQVPLFEDITKLSGKILPPVDVLCGGFPCQDVSSGGKRAGIKQGTRSGLWSEYARLISEIRPKYAIIENVRGLLSCGIEIVLQDLANIGYDAEWEVLPAAALGAPHRRERVFVVAYPNGAHVDEIGRVLSPLKGIVGNGNEHWRIPDWPGIRFDRARKASSREAYGERVLCRVDDGRSPWLDVPDSIKRITVETAKAWQPRLKALGNGIVPQQAYAVGMCIMKAEGLVVPGMQN